MAEAAAPAAALRVCAVCAAEAVSQCTNCKLVAFCSRRCQKAHWKAGHKGRCFSAQERATFNTRQNGRRLFMAAFEGDEAAILDLSARGADVNYRDRDTGGTPLCVACLLYTSPSPRD